MLFFENNNFKNYNGHHSKNFIRKMLVFVRCTQIKLETIKMFDFSQMFGLFKKGKILQRSTFDGTNLRPKFCIKP